MNIVKYTEGFITQVFDSENSQLVSQKFDAVSSETFIKNGKLTENYDHLYHPFDMKCADGCEDLDA